MIKIPRLAYFPDSFLEVNGVAMTSNRFMLYAKERNLPVLCIHAGPGNETYSDGSISYLSLKRSPLSFQLDEKLAYDPFFQRYAKTVRRKLLEFRPDIIHITGLNDISILGNYLAWKLDIPVLGSWHTNLHEFAARRLMKLGKFLPDAMFHSLSGIVEQKILEGALLYYKIPKVVLAPNQELVDILAKSTGRTARLMTRGVDTELFNPQKRTAYDGKFRLGFAGRLRAEKNVRMLVDLENRLIAAGKSGFEFLIVGEGSEREFLEKNMKFAHFTGFLEGEKLAETYANMDLFIFPSETDAFGNVVQEANASGVPAIVTDKGGPKFVVQNGITGFIASDSEQFAVYTIRLMDNPAERSKIAQAALKFARSRSWNVVFDGVYDAYRECIDIALAKKAEAANNANCPAATAKSEAAES